jgi:hypothetical protein
MAASQIQVDAVSSATFATSWTKLLRFGVIQNILTRKSSGGHQAKRRKEEKPKILNQTAYMN